MNNGAYVSKPSGTLKIFSITKITYNFGSFVVKPQDNWGTVFRSLQVFASTNYKMDLEWWCYLGHHELWFIVLECLSNKLLKITHQKCQWSCQLFIEIVKSLSQSGEWARYCSLQFTVSLSNIVGSGCHFDLIRFTMVGSGNERFVTNHFILRCFEMNNEISQGSLFQYFPEATKWRSCYNLWQNR